MQLVAKPIDSIEEIMRRNLESFRKEAGYSQAEIAELAGIPSVNYGRYERGENAVPATVLKALADAYGRSVDDFYEADPPAPKHEPPTFTLRSRPGAEVDKAVYERLRAEVDRANKEIRGRKGKR